MKQYKRNIPMIAITSLPLTAVSEGFQYVYQDDSRLYRYLPGCVETSYPQGRV